MSLLLAILAIVALVIVHELGHFLVARAVGMRVERFSLFFPPTIARLRGRETEYAIGVLPAGGYVKITGMTIGELANTDLRIAVRGYALQAPWKRIAVILAGPAMNVLVAFVMFFAILASGNLDGERTLGELNPSINTVGATVARVQQGVPASGVLRAGDEILAADGRAASIGETLRAINSHRCAGVPRDGCEATSAVTLRLRRAGREITVSVRPRYSASAKPKRMLIGFTPGESARHFGALSAARVVVEEMWATTTHLISSVGHAFTSEKVRGEFHSIVGVTQIAGESVAAGAGFALVVIAFISLVLAVINLFPFLPLDGGHVLWSLAEKMRGRRISIEAMYRFSSVGIVLLLFLVLNGLSNDISRLGG